MSTRTNLTQKVFAATRDQGLSSILFRNAIAHKLGLNIAESGCMSLLGIKGASTPTEISKFTGLTSGATTTMLDRLEAKGFIVRKRNPNDRRGVVIEVDQKYSKLAGPLVAGVQKANRELIESYTDAELETIADFLVRFTGNVVEGTKMQN